MSHFSVLVIGPDHEKQLAPYHEFECTGIDDEFVKDIDRTEEVRADYEAATVIRLKLPDGTLADFFDEKGNWIPAYSREAEHGRRTYFVPAGCEQVEVPAKQVETFADYASSDHGWPIVPFGHQPALGNKGQHGLDLPAEHKYGYIIVDECGAVVKCIDRTNPNAKWDWYQVGGRWSGFFKLKPGATGALGSRGLMGASRSTEHGRADVLTKGAIDLESMRNDAALRAAADWDRHASITNGARWEPWAAVRDKYPGDHEKAREFYNEQPAVIAMRNDKAFNRRHWDGVDEFLTPRDKFIERAKGRAVTTFAVVYNGEWSARGSMGWFGAVSDAMDEDKWAELFNALIDGLPDDTLLTVVDCHI